MSLTKRIKSVILTASLCSLISAAWAQKGFTYAAAVSKVPAKGFYKISLPPQVVAKSTADLSDVRIVDKDGKFVPYIAEGDLPGLQKQEFVVLRQVPLKLNADTGSAFILENSSTSPVDKIWITLKNTAVNRTVNIFGSDNLKSWYAIEEGVPLQASVLNNEGSFLQSLAFPGSTYRYIKLLVNDKNKAPIKFLQAGIYRQKSDAALYWPIPIASVSKKDSGKFTCLSILLNDYYEVNLLKLQISSPRYYNRDISVFIPGKPTKSFVCQAELNPAKPAEAYLSAKTNRLYLQIDNGDNSPLDITRITLSQREKYIVSYLQADKDYRLITGNQHINAPDYDLKFFKDSIGEALSNIGLSGALQYIGPAKNTLATKNDYTLVIWITAIIALIILTLLAIQLASEVNKKSLNRHNNA